MRGASFAPAQRSNITAPIIEFVVARGSIQSHPEWVSTCGLCRGKNKTNNRSWEKGVRKMYISERSTALYITYHYQGDCFVSARKKSKPSAQAAATKLNIVGPYDCTPTERPWRTNTATTVEFLPRKFFQFRSKGFYPGGRPIGTSDAHLRPEACWRQCWQCDATNWRPYSIARAWRTHVRIVPRCWYQYCTLNAPT